MQRWCSQSTKPPTSLPSLQSILEKAPRPSRRGGPGLGPGLKGKKMQSRSKAGLLTSLYRTLEVRIGAAQARQKEKESMTPSTRRDRHHMSILNGRPYSHVTCCLVCLLDKLKKYRPPRRRGPISSGARRNDNRFRQGLTRHSFGDTLRVYRLIVANLPKERIDSRRVYRLYWSVYIQYVRPLLRFRTVLKDIEFVSDYYRSLMELYKIGRQPPMSKT